jgi:anti-sigma B factor antagonist
MKVEKRNAGGVLILTLRGRITLGEGDELLKDAIFAAVDEGSRNVLIDLGDVPYIDSAGLGELVRSYTTVSRRGGTLRLCGLTKRLQDLLSITKLLTVFEVYGTVDEALAAAGVSRRKEVRCPLIDCHTWSILAAPDATVACAGCGSHYSCVEPAPGAVAISRLTVPTYEGEEVELTSGDPATITVRGRLDLFAADVLERVWQTVPAPRRVLIDTSGATEVSSAAADVVASLCDMTSGGGRTVHFGTTGHGPLYFSDRDLALGALAESSGGGALRVEIREAS